MERYSTFDSYKLPETKVMVVRCTIVYPTFSSCLDSCNPCRCGVTNRWISLKPNLKPLYSMAKEAQIWLCLVYLVIIGVG